MKPELVWASKDRPEVQLLSLDLRLLHALLDLRDCHGRLLDRLLLLHGAAQVSGAVNDPELVQGVVDLGRRL